MEITLAHAALLIVAGFVSGIINTLAGGGSFLTLAALNFVGLPITIANGSNRLGILLGAIAGALGFRSKGASEIKTSLHYAIPALFGAIVGAYLVIDIKEVVFERVLGVCMLLMLAILILNPKKWLEGRVVVMTPRRRAISYVVFFLVGIYGGAIQAGIGFLLIASLVVTAGVDLVKANMHKVFITATYTIVALLIFALQGQVNWTYGLVLTIGYGLGSWLSSRIAIEKGQGFVRLVLALSLVVLAAQYLGLFSL
ncbi:MAG: sulfite exporter TauE/SafE family protein [Anaerolineae bacterium]